MLLTISTTHRPATDLGYLLHKHPDKCQSFDLNFGRAHVFYPEVSEDRTTAALLLDVDPVGLVRGKAPEQGFLLDQYVNDRPYVASSFLSVAIAQVFGSAMSGRSKDRPELVEAKLPLTAAIEVLPVRGGTELLHKLFEPLGYTVEAKRHTLDERFPEWGDSPYYSVTIAGTVALSDLLSHLYVLVPVFDDRKHYYVGDDELEKLLDKGAGWLASHPEKETISRRYLKHRPGLWREAINRLLGEDAVAEDDDEQPAAKQEEALERTISLNEQRHAVVLEALRASGAKSVFDLGCAEGKLLRSLASVRQFERIVGVDVAIRSLEIASRRLKLDRGSDRIQLLHGSLMYRDDRIAGFDAAAVVEVIEHLDPPRLAAFERVLFEFARPKCIVMTTPNREYNALWPTLPAGRFRHADHRFEWTRAEFQDWSNRIASRFGYSVRFVSIGAVDEALGAPTQMGVFQDLAQSREVTKERKHV